MNPIIKRYPTGSIRELRWEDRNGLHREDGPAWITYHENGNVEKECWWNHGTIHRLNGPCCLIWNSYGKMKEEYWAENGKFHRWDGPASILFYPSGNVEEEMWYVHGENVWPQICDMIYKLYKLPHDWREWTDEHKFLVRISLDVS